MSEESTKPPVKSDNSPNQGINYTNNAKIRVKFDGNCLEQEKVIFTYKTMLHFHTVCEINLWPLNQDCKFPFSNFLFGAVKLTIMLIS